MLSDKKIQGLQECLWLATDMGFDGTRALIATALAKAVVMPASEIRPLVESYDARLARFEPTGKSEVRRLLAMVLEELEEPKEGAS